MTVGETYRQQGRTLLDYPADALTAARAGSTAPQLLASGCTLRFHELGSERASIGKIVEQERASMAGWSSA